MRNRKYGIGVFSLVAVLASLAGGVRADVITIQPDATAGKDAYVFDNDPDTNYGTSTALSVRNRNVTLHGRSFLEFDISGVPAGQVVTNAYLELYEYFIYEDTNDDVTLNVYRVTNSWSESTLTWNNQPGDAGTAYGSVIIDNTHDESWRSFDVTDLVKDWYAGTNNYGMVVRTETLGYTKGAAFRSSDDAVATRPKLIVEYAVIPEPATIGLFTVASAGVLLLRRMTR